MPAYACFTGSSMGSSQFPFQTIFIPKTWTSKNCHSMTFRQIHTHRNFYKYSFFPLAIIQCNALPESVVCLPTLDAFKEEVGKLHPPLGPKSDFFFLIFSFNPSTSPAILTQSPFILSLSPLYSFVYISFFFQQDSAHLPRMPVRAWQSIQRKKESRYRMISWLPVNWNHRKYPTYHVVSDIVSDIALRA